MDTNVVNDSCIDPINDDYTLRNQSASIEDNFVDFQTWIRRLKALVQDNLQDSLLKKGLDINENVTPTILDSINTISIKSWRQTSEC